METSLEIDIKVLHHFIKTLYESSCVIIPGEAENDRMYVAGLSHAYARILTHLEPLMRRNGIEVPLEKLGDSDEVDKC
jgi:hypothetical protein